MTDLSVRLTRSIARGFTLIEILTVLAIIGVLAALIFPVFARAREKGRQASCASNLRQLGMAMSLYTTDNDETHPTGLTPPGLFDPPYLDSMGWAGRIYPYVKSIAVFHCPTDTNTATRMDEPGRTAYPLSYAINWGLVATSHVSGLSAPAKTVLLFEVAGSKAQITLPTEGIEVGGALPPRLSAEGTGVNGSILDLTASWKGPGQGRFTIYATGFMDNSDGIDASDDYQGQPGRHSDGANYLAADGHVKWLPGKSVSAGLPAATATSLQSHRGCRYFPFNDSFAFACAEGTAVNQHVLTFSPH